MAQHRYSECRMRRVSLMLSVTYDPFMLNLAKLSVVMLSVVMLSVVMLKVMALYLELILIPNIDLWLHLQNH
jgi:hypothetical protein